MEEEKLTIENNFGCSGAFETLGKYQKFTSFKKPPLLREITEVIVCNIVITLIILTAFLVFYYFFPEIFYYIKNPIKAALTL